MSLGLKEVFSCSGSIGVSRSIFVLFLVYGKGFLHMGWEWQCPDGPFCIPSHSFQGPKPPNLELRNAIHVSVPFGNGQFYAA